MAEHVSEFFGDKLYLYIGLGKEEAARFVSHVAPAVQQIERIGKTFGGRLAEFAHLGITRLDVISRPLRDQQREIIDTKRYAVGRHDDYRRGSAPSREDLEKELRSEKLRYSN